jgi:Na+/melibiose symporter-like transporter
VVLALRYIPTDVPLSRRTRIDVPGAILVTGGLSLLVFVLSTPPTAGWGTAWRIGLLLLSLVLLVLFVLHERRATQALVDLGLFRTRNVAFAVVIYLANMAAFSSVFFFPTLYLQNRLQFSPLEAGLSFVPMALVLIVTAGLVSRVVGRIGYKIPMVLGLMVSGVGLLLLARLPVDGNYAGDILPALLILAVGSGAAIVSITIAATEGVSAERSGLASGLLSTSQQLGMALGLAILSAVASIAASNSLIGRVSTAAIRAAAEVQGYRAAFAVAAVIVLACAALALVGIRQSRPSNAAAKWLVKFHGQ